MIVSWLALRVPLVRHLVTSSPVRLVPNGRVVAENLRRELISPEDLHSKLRLHGVENVADVRDAWLEPDGEISVVKVR
jgi:uncharacterized membrane protein YcaP (DUF421 family)